MSQNRALTSSGGGSGGGGGGGVKSDQSFGSDSKVISLESKRAGGGGGGGGHDVTPETQRYVDQKIETAQARTETEFSRLQTQIAELPKARDIRVNIWGAAATVLGILIAVVALGIAFYDSGVQVAATSVERVVGTQQAVRENSERIDKLSEELNTKVDALIEAVSKSAEKQ